VRLSLVNGASIQFGTSQLTIRLQQTQQAELAAAPKQRAQEAATSK
jgi:hypothetical protein